MSTAAVERVSSFSIDAADPHCSSFYWKPHRVVSKVQPRSIIIDASRSAISPRVGTHRTRYPFFLASRGVYPTRELLATSLRHILLFALANGATSLSPTRSRQLRRTAKGERSTSRRILATGPGSCYPVPPSYTVHARFSVSPLFNGLDTRRYCHAVSRDTSPCL